MTHFEYLFEEPYEIEVLTYHSEDLIESGDINPLPYRKDTLTGNKKGIDYFFQICRLFKYEMGYLTYIQNKNKSIFERISSVLRSSFLWMVKKESSLEDILQKEIEDLKLYNFTTCRPKNPFMRSYSPNHADYKEVEITVDRISRMIQKLRRHRIEFYDLILQEYLARKDQYNLRLREYLKHTSGIPPINSSEANLVTISLEFESSDKDIWPEEIYDIDVTAWYLKDLLKLTNPAIEKYTEDFDDLTRYRADDILGYTEGMDSFSDIFLIFKEEMSYLLTKDLNKSFFEKTLTVLIRDFIGEFEQLGDLEDVIIDYIENLEKYEFFSLQREALFDKLSKMIYSLRARHIKFYEAVLTDYLANKKKYDKLL